MNANARLTILTRVGFATRGMLYLVIATLILRTGRAEDPGGALHYLGQGGGQLLLGVMSIGLVAYGIWRLADATLDIERHGTDRKGWAERIGAGVSGIVHLALAWQAVGLMRGAAQSGDSTREGAELALRLPGGWALVMIGAAVLFALGVVQIVKAVKGSFLRYLDPGIRQRPWVRWSGRAGYAARGIVFLITGWLLLNAGIEEQLTGTLFGAPIYKTYGDFLVEDRFRPAGFTAPLGLKDMGLVDAAATAAREPMPLLGIVRDHLRTAIAVEGEDVDWVAAGLAVRRGAGLG